MASYGEEKLWFLWFGWKSREEHKIRSRIVDYVQGLMRHDFVFVKFVRRLEVSDHFVEFPVRLLGSREVCGHVGENVVAANSMVVVVVEWKLYPCSNS